MTYHALMEWFPPPILLLFSSSRNWFLMCPANFYLLTENNARESPSTQIQPHPQPHSNRAPYSHAFSNAGAYEQSRPKPIPSQSDRSPSSRSHQHDSSHSQPSHHSSPYGHQDRFGSTPNHISRSPNTAISSEPAWTKPIVVDTSHRRIPIAVQHDISDPSRRSLSTSAGGSDLFNSATGTPIQRTRRFSEEDRKPPWAIPASSRSNNISNSWQSTPGRNFPSEFQGDSTNDKGNDFGPGSYATLPTKGSSGNRNRAFHNSNKSNNIFDRTDSIKSKPTEVDYNNPYPTLPNIRPLKSSATLQNFGSAHGPSEEFKYRDGQNGDSSTIKSSQSYDFGRRDLEHTLNDKDYSKPLWENTGRAGGGESLTQQSSLSSSQDDVHSPHSDNAVSSSDSRDTIIAKDLKSSDESLPAESSGQMPRQKDSSSGTTTSRYSGGPDRPSKPLSSSKERRMIPIQVVHESPSSTFSTDVDAAGFRGKETLRNEESTYALHALGFIQSMQFWFTVVIVSMLTEFRSLLFDLGFVTNPSMKTSLQFMEHDIISISFWMESCTVCHNAPFYHHHRQYYYKQHEVMRIIHVY